MKRFSLILNLILCYGPILFITACKKKTEPISYSGQLLLSKKHPVPVSNRKIEIYQQGSAPAIGINSGSTSASAAGLTNSSGNFQIDFTPGTSRFIVFYGANSSPLVLQSAFGDTVFPNFSRNNFPGKEYNSSEPTYVGKIIDTAIIQVYLNSDLNSTDTIGLRANTVNFGIDKQYTGLSGNAGATITIDTVNNLLLTQFDCYQQRFTNTVSVGRKWTTIWGYSAINSTTFPLPNVFSDLDEAKVEMTFVFTK